VLINADVKGLEVVTAAQLSGDKTLCREILDGEDIHGNNQRDFNLVSRLIAKIFKFRLIYGGSAYSYANDPEFNMVSREQSYWQEIIDKYYAKYWGIAQWHKQLTYEAQSTGRIEIPSGRYYPITPDYKKREPWPLTIIKNYPVQGFGADLVMLARLRANQLLEQSGLEALLVCTIHDSIVADTQARNVEAVGRLLKQSVEEVPKLVKQTWDYDFKLPLTAEVQYGMNKADMQELRL
jgi:DNA polymerase I-like protein with 3'-5' exonuclease and polymerase domains